MCQAFETRKLENYSLMVEVVCQRLLAGIDVSVVLVRVKGVLGEASGLLCSGQRPRLMKVRRWTETG